VSPDQAAVVAAQAAEQTANATWALFWATTALAAFTIALVGIGLIGARSAFAAYQLESEPVLVVTCATELRYPPTIYVIDGNPSLAKGLILRPWRHGDGSEGELRSGSLILDIENLGRSPAMTVELDVDLSVGLALKPGEEAVGFDEDPPDDRTESNFPMRSGNVRSLGVIPIPGVAAQGIAQILIASHIGLQTRITVRPFGRQLRWHTKRRKTDTIAVVSPSEPFTVEAAT
jgi:hypothetical protein